MPGYSLSGAAAGDFLQFLEKGRSQTLQLLFEALGAIAVLARPGLAAVEVTALAPVMRVLHFDQLEELFPIRPLLLERRRTVANLDPADLFSLRLPRLTHIPEVLASGNGSSPQASVFDRLKQGLFASGLDARSYQVTHASFILPAINMRLNSSVH
jgi:hypothetical protein